MGSQEIIEFDPDDISQEESKKLKKSIKKLKSRCDTADIELVEHQMDDLDVFYQLRLPAGRDFRPLLITDLDDVKNLLKIDFEKYVYLNRYHAICSYEDGYIEAVIEPLTRVPSRMLFKRLFGLKFEQGVEVKYSENEIKITQPEDDGNIEISVGYPSKECQTLLPRRNSISFKIKGVTVNTHDKATNILEKIANSVLFQIDLKRDIALTLSRYVRHRIPKTTKSNKKLDLIDFPSTQYDLEPISLYWYAKTAAGLPLLQFLAFYQSIEFYFPVYSETEAKKIIKNILKNPTFNKFSDSDLTRLLNAIRAKMGRGFENEKSMLKATLNECIDVDQLRNYLKQDEEVLDFFTSSKCHELSKHKLNCDHSDLDLINSVTERIYDIRCKIVHTKAGDNQTNVDLLLPFSKEVDILYYDIDLIKYISQQVIIAGSSPLS